MKEPRISLAIVLFFLGGAAVTGKLFFLQVVNYDFYSALAEGQHSFFENMVGDRGEIFLQDKSGETRPLASNVSSSICFASLSELEETKETVSKVSQILSMEEDALSKKFEESLSNFLVIKEDLTDGEVSLIKEASLAGIYTAVQKKRNYPYNDFASHLTGFVNKDGEGQYGTEQYYDELLSPESLFLEGEKGPAGYFFPGQEAILKGADIFLTIDYNIQFQAEKLLDFAKESLNADSGQIIVIEPHTGKILALASLPGYDPNSYASEEMGDFVNGAIQKLFEPGSVLKALTMASAMNEGAVTPNTTYNDVGYVEVGGHRIENYDQRVYGEGVTMTEVLEKSINTGAMFAEKELGHQKFLEYLEKFGLFETTDIDLPGESFSLNQELKKGYEAGFATASFGQGIALTPIQLVMAFCVLANGGDLVTPYVVEKIVKGDKITVTEPEVKEEKVISKETSSKITAMLVSVVENAFSRRAQIPGYYVAGKTGTAQIPLEGEYSDKTWQSFIGYAPAFDPRFLILVKLDDPEAKTAEYSAIPVFHDLAKYIIDYYQISPDE
jgi:cell division protein FtsI (penicillin-binding protein 3)/stage V sporulation protein D (sporulation-specific penicillin-binding protein)